jgi:hypothetical protein
LNPPPKKISGYATGSTDIIFKGIYV